MANINLSKDNYQDKKASMYFKALNVVDLELKPKVVKVKDEDVVLLHIDGVQTTTGTVLNIDMWPRNNATEEDLKSLPKSFDDIIFRIGYWPEINENGETVLRQGAPKWVSYDKGNDKRVEFVGGKREYEGED